MSQVKWREPGFVDIAYGPMDFAYFAALFLCWAICRWVYTQKRAVLSV